MFKKINETATLIEKITGINPLTVSQSSEEWFKLKLGVISASEIDNLLGKKDKQGRMTYMCQLIAQVATGLYPETNAKQLEWGKEHEQAARSAYEMITGHEVHQVGTIFKDEKMRACASADGLIFDKEEFGLELKCPFNSGTHAEFICNDKIKKDYILQCQFGMWNLKSNIWKFASFDPRFKASMLKEVTIERDDLMMKEFDERVPEFIWDMDVMMNRAGIVWGQQWK